MYYGSQRLKALAFTAFKPLCRNALLSQKGAINHCLLLLFPKASRKILLINI
jgi:hypothetical protein